MDPVLRVWPLSGVAIFDLDYDAILSAVYALSASAEGDCYRCVPPDPGIEAAALGASESSLPGTAPAEALHTFTLDSGASRCFFRDSTTLTPLPAPVPFRLADPSGGPVVARSSTVLPCLAVGASAQVSASGQVAPPCSCRLLSHQTLLWHHRLGHPSLPRLRGMHSRLLVSSLPKPLPPLPPSPTPPCLPCVEGRQRAAPHSSSFPPTTAPLQTLHMDVWGPARISGQGCERYFLLVDDDYMQYTTVFPLRSKGQVVDVLIPWIRAVHLQLRERFCADLPVLHLHSDRGGEFSFDLLQDFCRGEGILQSSTSSPVSPCQTSPTLRWTGKVGDASVFRVDPLLGTAPVEVAVGSGAARRAVSGGAASGGAEPGVAESEGAGSWLEGVEPGGAQSEGAESGGAGPRGVASSGGAGAAVAGGAGITFGASGTGGTAATSPGGARTRGTRAAGTGGVGGAGAGGSGACGAGAGGGGVVDPGDGGARAGGAGGLSAGGTVRPRPYFVPLIQQPASPLPAPSPYTEQSGGLTERREPASRLVSPVRTTRRVPWSRPPPVPGTHAMALRPSSVPLRIPPPAPLESSLPEAPSLESICARATSPTVSRLLATAVTDPSFESAAASALVAELLDFVAACHLDYATALVAEFESAYPLSVGGECALDTDVLEERQDDLECLAAAVPRFASMLLAPEGDPDAPDIPTPRSYAEAITSPYSSQWQAAMNVEMASSKSTGT
ncbi:unnamed protein product [Closterium sp. NIES-54]